MFVRCLLVQYQTSLGLEIPDEAVVGPGLHLSHPGSIVVHPLVRIGRDCNLSHEVTIGTSARGARPGVPTVGDGVYIGPGAKIFGAIHIGDNVAIGANCVVTRNVPDNAVVVGVPGRVISLNGAREYVINTDYPGS